jgi:ferredoxin
MAVTGVYLFVFFETSISGVFDSVQAITEGHFYIGGLMRSLHRYASAGMAIVVTLHLVKEMSMKRFTGARVFSWISGVPLLWLLFASALVGYWLVWDDRAQYIAQTTATLFDTLPIVVEPMAFGFIEDARVSDRFFTLLIFLHVGIPLSLLLGMFIHIKQISDAKAFPDRGLAGAVLFGLLVISVVHPATSGVPADMDQPLRTISIDWIYMNAFPLVDHVGPGTFWIVVLGVTGALLALPIFIRDKEKIIAAVDPEFCNGCGWCFIDCPYDAVYMKDHDFKEGHRQSVVISDKCVGCGICAGACPTATPFKSVNKAFSGINLTNETNADILVRVQSSLESKAEDKDKVLVVGCHHGPKLKQLESDSVDTLAVECIGQLPPSYIDYLCRKDGLAAVLLTGCSSGDCFHRLGIEIQEGRLAHEREPHLRYQDVAGQVATCWAGSGGEKQLETSLREVQEALGNAHEIG